MTLPAVALRPEPGLGDTVAAAQKMGLIVIAAPLFAIEPIAWSAPDARAYDGLLIGSANAFRHGGSLLQTLVNLPVHAVGERTAEAARAAGFTVAKTGQGGLQTLLDEMAGPARLLRLAGDERVLLDVPPDIRIDERVIYRAVPMPLAGAAIDALQAGAVAMLHSGAAAERLAAECDQHAIDRAGVRLAALAPRIARRAGDGWACVEVAVEATDCALLALTARLCQECWNGQAPAGAGSQNGTE